MLVRQICSAAAPPQKAAIGIHPTNMINCTKLEPLHRTRSFPALVAQNFISVGPGIAGYGSISSHATLLCSALLCYALPCYALLCCSYSMLLCDPQHLILAARRRYHRSRSSPRRRPRRPGQSPHALMLLLRGSSCRLLRGRVQRTLARGLAFPPHAVVGMPSLSPTMCVARVTSQSLRSTPI